jgi:hypothetical protein
MQQDTTFTDIHKLTVLTWNKEDYVHMPQQKKLMQWSNMQNVPFKMQPKNNHITVQK